MKLSYIAEGRIIETWHYPEHSNRMMLGLKVRTFSNLMMQKARKILESLGLMKDGNRHTPHTLLEPASEARELFLAFRRAVQQRIARDVRTLQETGLESSEAGEIELFWGYDFSRGTYGTTTQGTFDDLIQSAVRSGRIERRPGSWTFRPLGERLELLESLIDLI